jgi:uncharacterized circularly permuted ATP-grasp superfamily protein/uncharacterized alpha-E superfamily protein
MNAASCDMTAPAPATEFRICRGYPAADGVFDEMAAADGSIRPHWVPLVRAVDALGPGELGRRQQEIRRMLRENGVTYNVHGDPDGLNRPWELDPLPMVVSGAEWDGLEAGVRQRAVLLDLLLADLYGERRAVREGVLPAELVFAQPGFLRACDGIRPPGRRRLVIYAADLARGPDRGFQMLRDRTQAPAGMGYALENRTVLAQIYPDLMRDCNVRRLSAFFGTLRAALAAIAPGRREAPRAALLTPGPRSETYFEQAYLSAYLGYTLVQGDDLTMRNGSLWLKALDGLKPVDILLRRLDDDTCDPLELRPDSLLGVPGMLEAVRRGKLALANPLGSGALENLGLLAFLPALARFFLGAELALPSTPTWWCGSPESRGFVFDNLDRLVIRPAAYRAHAPGVRGDRLEAGERETLKARILASPHAFVAQEPHTGARMPSLHNGGLEPRSGTLRVFLVADGPDYAVMPGGLTLSDTEIDAAHPAAFRGAVSKDTWVLADAPQSHVSLWLQPGRVQDNLKISSILTSRAAENLFWVGRYAERSEGILRLLRTVLRNHFQVDSRSEGAEAGCLRFLLAALAALTDEGGAPARPNGDGGTAGCEEDLLAVITDARRSGNLYANLRHMFRAAYAVRHLWSNDSWRVINGLDEQWREMRGRERPDLREIFTRLDQLIIGMMAFAGLNSESMTREQGWLLLDTGRRLERGLYFTGLLRTMLAPRHDPAVAPHIFEAVLSTTENIITYRHRYRSYMELRTILDQLMLDSANPRSIVYQLNRLRKHVAALPRERLGHGLAEEERLAAEAQSLLHLADLDRLTEPLPEAPVLPRLEGLLKRLGALLSTISDVLTQVYFSHAPMSRQLTAGPGGTGDDLPHQA